MARNLPIHMSKLPVLLTEDAGRMDGRPIKLLIGLTVQQDVCKCITNIGGNPNDMGKAFIRFGGKPVIVKTVVHKVPETEFEEG